MNWYYIIPLLFITMILVMFIPIKLIINYKRINDQDEVNVQVSILFFTIHLTKSSPLIKLLSLMSRRKPNVEEVKEAIETERLPNKNWMIVFRRLNILIPKFIQISSHAVKLTTKTLKPIKCKSIKLYSEIGFFDASKTGIVTGSMWAINSFMLSQLSRWMVIKPETFKIKIIPDYTKSKILLDYDCIIIFPLGHIIIVLIQTARFVRVSYHLLKGVNQ